jgi:hypothetical protein
MSSVEKSVFERHAIAAVVILVGGLAGLNGLFVEGVIGNEVAIAAIVLAILELHVEAHGGSQFCASVQMYLADDIVT